MRFCQFEQNSKVCLGVQIDNGNVVDVSSVAQDLKSLIEGGEVAMQAVDQAVQGQAGVPLDQLKLAPAIHNAQKVICVGLNYRDHCEEQNLPIPKEPVIFNKFPETLTAAGDPIQLPKVGCNTDLEAELAIIIGKSGKHISKVPNSLRSYHYFARIMQCPMSLATQSLTMFPVVTGRRSEMAVSGFWEKLLTPSVPSDQLSIPALTHQT